MVADPDMAADADILDIEPSSERRSGAASRWCQTRSRPATAAIASDRSSADASTWLSVPCGVHETA